ncbi:MAG: polysaccharide lyase [Bacilli bacterium]
MINRRVKVFIICAVFMSPIIFIAALYINNNYINQNINKDDNDKLFKEDSDTNENNKDDNNENLEIINKDDNDSSLNDKLDETLDNSNSNITTPDQLDDEKNEDLIFDKENNEKNEISTDEISETYEVVLGFENFDINQSLSRNALNLLDVKTSNWDNGLSTRTKIINDDDNKVLQVYYPENKFGPIDTGMQVEFTLDKNNEYYMSYDFKFDSNFSFGSDSKGGKLPGITGGSRCGNDFKCDGTDGFSARFMWKKEGLGELYLYHVDMKHTYGDDIAFINNKNQIQFTRNKWYNIKEYVKINTESNEYDGIIKVWIDDILVVNINNVRLTTNGDLIDTFYFSTFHGGNNLLWTPENDSYMYYDNIKVSKTNF